MRPDETVSLQTPVIVDRGTVLRFMPWLFLTISLGAVVSAILDHAQLQAIRTRQQGQLQQAIAGLGDQEAYRRKGEALDAIRKTWRECLEGLRSKLPPASGMDPDARIHSWRLELEAQAKQKGIRLTGPLAELRLEDGETVSKVRSVDPVETAGEALRWVQATVQRLLRCNPEGIGPIRANHLENPGDAPREALLLTLVFEGQTKGLRAFFNELDRDPLPLELIGLCVERLQQPIAPRVEAIPRLRQEEAAASAIAVGAVPSPEHSIPKAGLRFTVLLSPLINPP
jgi:hypothetical protein